MTGLRGELGSLADAEAAFAHDHPAYASTSKLGELRRTDFARLDAGGHVYLDYTGGGLYADSQLREHFELLHSGAIRASLGLASNYADLHAFADLAREFIDLGNVPPDLPPRLAC